MVRTLRGGQHGGKCVIRPRTVICCVSSTNFSRKSSMMDGAVDQSVRAVDRGGGASGVSPPLSTESCQYGYSPTCCSPWCSLLSLLNGASTHSHTHTLLTSFSHESYKRARWEMWSAVVCVCVCVCVCTEPVHGSCRLMLVKQIRWC